MLKIRLGYIRGKENSHTYKKQMKFLNSIKVDRVFAELQGGNIVLIEEIDGGVVVKVGSVEHPMLPEHYIQWIEVHTENKIYRKYLKPGEKPEATFQLDEKLVMVREYCNLHGLWKK